MNAAPANDAPADPAAPAGPVAPEVLTIAELAALLRVHPTTVYEEVAAGRIPGARKVGGAWRVHRPTVVAWLAGQDRESPPKKARRR